MKYQCTEVPAGKVGMLNVYFYAYCSDRYIHVHNFTTHSRHIHHTLSNQRFQRKFGNPKNGVVFYMLLFFEPSLEPLGKLGFSTILDDSSSS